MNMPLSIAFDSSGKNYSADFCEGHPKTLLDGMENFISTCVSASTNTGFNTMTSGRNQNFKNKCGLTWRANMGEVLDVPERNVRKRSMHAPPLKPMEVMAWDGKSSWPVTYRHG